MKKPKLLDEDVFSILEIKDACTDVSSKILNEINTFRDCESIDINSSEELQERLDEVRRIDAVTEFYDCLMFALAESLIKIKKDRKDKK